MIGEWERGVKSLLFLSSPWKRETDGKVRELGVIEICNVVSFLLKKSGNNFKAKKKKKPKNDSHYWIPKKVPKKNMMQKISAHDFSLWRICL